MCTFVSELSTNEVLRIILLPLKNNPTMKQNRLFVKTLVASALLLGGVNSADAQFGKLKGLADKAKKEVKNKASEKVSDTKKSVVSQASDAAGVPTGDAPSAEGVVWR